MSEKIWYEDILTFILDENSFRKLLPLKTMSLEEKINAIIRLAILLGVIVSLIAMDAKYLMIPVIALAVSFPLYEFEKNEKVLAETFFRKNNIEIVDTKACTRSTIDNPFMNPSVVDSTSRLEACNMSLNDSIKQQVEDNFSNRVFKDSTDIWGKNFSAREFYTVPSTTIPNKQGEFASWLYGTGATCKEGNSLMCTYKNYRHTLR